VLRPSFLVEHAAEATSSVATKTECKVRMAAIEPLQIR
jgi:hypothetical protein